MIAWFGFRALPLNRAIICSTLAGLLLLPSKVVVELPGMPDLNKDSVVLMGIIATYLGHRRSRPVESIPRMSVFLMAMLLASTLGTVLTNADPQQNPLISIPGLTMYDALGTTFGNILSISAVVIGIRALSQTEDHREMLLLVGAAMVLYSFPILLEIRISPQLHRWVYGIHPAAFDQQMRGGGFRSTVFMSHGLVLAWFLAMGTAAMMALRRSDVRVFGFRSTALASHGLVVGWFLTISTATMTALRRSDVRVFGLRPLTLSVYLWVVLFLQKSLGALMLGSLMNLVLLMRPRRQVGIAAAVALIVLAYPVVRGSGLVPVEWINSKVAEYSLERSGSLGTRLFNEDQLLAKANERPWFGWGGWKRSRVFDPESGRDISITDGHWIITLGHTGWVGYIAQFGLICLPLIGLYRYRRRIPFETAALAVILSGNLIDMIPNSSITPFTWLMTGALTGALAAARRGTTDRQAVKDNGSWSVGMKPALEGAALREHR